MTGVLDHDGIDLDVLDPRPAAPPPTYARSRLRALWRGPETDPAWARPALFGLLAITAAFYLWDLGASGWANSYYAMAVQAGSKSWKALFFGSLDAGNSITVDKSPASLWVMDISARIFGVNSWSILVPQALEGVATVAVLYAAVKRWFGAPAGLLAGAIVACSPVAALMFRYNNPDALLVLLMVGAAYALVRALEHGSTKWLVFTFTLVGFGFLTKMLQALLVVPAFGAVYLFAGPPQLGRRIAQLALAAVALIVSAGWWLIAVMLTPASARPYIGGSQNNSLRNVIFGYNGFGRLTGNETGSVGGGTPGTAGRWGPTGWTRLFNSSFGGEASWFLPAAIILGVAGLAFTLRAGRTDRTRAALLIWGGWVFVTGVAFSLGKGIIHPYYTVALVPAIGALVGIGATRVWNGRAHPAARVVLAVAFAATAWWSYTLLNRTPSWHPELRTFVLLGGIAGTIALLASATTALRKVSVVVATGALGVALAGSTAYTLSNVTTPHSGAIPGSGPSGQLAGAPGGAQRAFGPRGGQFPSFGFGQHRSGGQFPPPFSGGNFQPRGGRGGVGGLLNGSKPSAEMTALLKQNASSYTWVAATVGADNASGYQLATDDPVMAIGGFNGTDPSPTLAQFESYVAQHKVHYFIGGGGFGGGGFGGGGGPQAPSSTSAIAQWVANNFTAQQVGGVTVYDLTTAN